MSLVLYNTLSRRKEAFQPIDPERVRLYVCGPTVYSFAHIGNARPVVVFDQLFRLLRHSYGEAQVVYARNITDIDDKIIDAARANGEDIADLTERTTAIFHADMAALHCLPPTIEPRATAHVGGMIRMIEQLVGSGHAYPAQGHVLFSVSAMADYGSLSRRSQEDMLAGARVEVAPYKKAPGNGFSPSKFLDLQMLLMPGGLERTEVQFRALFEAAGWRLIRVVPTMSLDSILEAEPA